MRNPKSILGFDEGYITIFQGDTYPYIQWFKDNGAKYNCIWGWSFASTVEMPDELPPGITPVRLEWDKIAENDELRPEVLIRKTADELRYGDSTSKYVGIIGDRITKVLTIIKIVPLNGAYGESNIYIFEDGEQNIYTWTTASSRNWKQGETYRIKGTVKNHQLFRNVQQTALSRCVEVKEE